MSADRWPPAFRLAYRRYVLGVLTGVYTLNLVDRGLIMLLLEPIKRDLRLSDSQLGLLTGIAFGLFYATLGLPIARWADRGNRVTITSLAIGLWGLTVMATWWVGNFVQLVFARMAAAIGEAGCKPPTYSLIGDYFPASAERTRAMAIYLSGGLLSTLVSFIVGGWLSEQYSWRMAFLLMGVPGLLLALLVKTTIVEPRSLIPRQEAASPAPCIKLVLRTLWQRPSCRHLGLGLICLYTMSLGLGPWYAAFLMRSHAMATGELGLWLGSIFGIGGVIGVLLGGYVSARWYANDERGQTRLSAITIMSLVPCFLAFLMVPHKSLALAALVPLIIAFSFFLGPTYALLQRLVPDEMRATMLSVVLLLANLVGMGVGPQVVGVLSDLLMPALGPHSLRYAMLAMSLVALAAGYHFWRAGESVRQDLMSGGSAPANANATHLVLKQGAFNGKAARN